MESVVPSAALPGCNAVTGRMAPAWPWFPRREWREVKL